MRLLDESVFDELYLEFNGVKVTLRRAARARRSQRAGTHWPAAAAVAPLGPGRCLGLRRRGLTDSSPLLGTFYRAPKPGAPPFVEVGSDVDVDSVIAIIEVMKLMNSVRAGVAARSRKSLVADETSRRIRRDADAGAQGRLIH